MKSKKGRYWVFGFDRENPKGGIDDFIFSFNSINEFEEDMIEYTSHNAFQVFDTRNNFSFQGDFGTVTTWICNNIGDERYEELSWCLPSYFVTIITDMYTHTGITAVIHQTSIYSWFIALDAKRKKLCQRLNMRYLWVYRK